MARQPSQPTFIRAAWRPLAAGLASLALSAWLHYTSAPPPASETVDLSCRVATLAPLAEDVKNQKIVKVTNDICRRHLGLVSWCFRLCPEGR
jgi:hypothetical protein